MMHMHISFAHVCVCALSGVLYSHASLTTDQADQHLDHPFFCGMGCSCLQCTVPPAYALHKLYYTVTVIVYI